MSAWSLIRSNDRAWEGERPEELPSGDTLHLILDAPSSVNALSLAVLEELDEALGKAAQQEGVRVLYLWSAKEEHFIAGADVDEIAEVDAEDAARQLAERGQRILDGFASLPFPSVAMIRGTCLGGGLELALACRYRIAVDDPHTRIGLPEVNLGIIPGFGGTQRLPRLIGLRGALTVILSGSRLPAKVALRRGIVDDLVPPEGFRASALAAGRKIVDSGGAAVAAKRKGRHRGFGNRLLEHTPLGRWIVRRATRKQVAAKTGGHYPAPPAAIDAVFRGWGRSLEAGLREEARLCAPLVVSSVSKNLIQIFQSSERARKLRIEGAPPPSTTPEFVGVLGAGIMGSGIAALGLERGLEVRLRDLSPEALEKGLSFVGSRLGKSARKKRLKPWQVDEILSRLTHTTGPEGFGRVTTVVEAIVERLDIKQKALAEMESRIAPDAVYASNTSALSLTALQAGARHPERVVGLHFFNPVHRMPLVEVIPGRQTAPWALARAVELSQTLGKYPVVVQDSPGFLVNRLLLPYLDSACRLLERGVPGEEVDRVAERFGLPMGPFRLLDEVGIDIAAEVAETLHEAFGSRAEPAPTLARLRERELLGRKGGAGFYRYEGERHDAGRSWNADASPTTTSAAAPVTDSDGIVRFLLDRMIDEAARCLDEEIVDGAATVDLAMVMGTGFPPFLGGPLRWADGLGLGRVVERLEKRAAAGEACEPSEFLRALARDDLRFHGEGSSAPVARPEPV